MSDDPKGPKTFNLHLPRFRSDSGLEDCSISVHSGDGVDAVPLAPPRGSRMHALRAFTNTAYSPPVAQSIPLPPPLADRSRDGYLHCP